MSGYKMKVYVISKENKPLMPTNPCKAKHLLKEGKAKCIRRTPFTIKLLYDTTTYTQPLTLGIDTGSKYIGSAVVNQKGEVIYSAETEIRNDIAEKMTRRAYYRRNRRNRKTRYRECRFLNRKNSNRKNRFSPTILSKINSHKKEIIFVKKILPITKLIIETGTFDPHALRNPEVLKDKLLYQKGINYGFANTKAYVLARDNYTCNICKKKNSSLHVHHIVFRSEGGSDEQENLISLCKICHDKLHSGEITPKLKGKTKGNLKHATQMNSIRIQLLKLFPEAIETFGYITKEHRQLYNFDKSHCTDAAIIANECKNIINNIEKVFLKKSVAKGDYRQTRGIRSEQKLPTGKIQGFRKFDKVKYLGKKYFIKGRMTRGGYAMLMNIKGEYIKLKPLPKFINIVRLSSRKSQIIVLQSVNSSSS
jgi:hypothetical protein